MDKVAAEKLSGTLAKQAISMQDLQWDKILGYLNANPNLRNALLGLLVGGGITGTGAALTGNSILPSALLGGTLGAGAGYAFPRIYDAFKSPWPGESTNDKITNKINELINGPSRTPGILGYAGVGGGLGALGGSALNRASGFKALQKEFGDGSAANAIRDSIFNAFNEGEAASSFASQYRSALTNQHLGETYRKADPFQKLRMSLGLGISPTMRGIDKAVEGELSAFRSTLPNSFKDSENFYRGLNAERNFVTGIPQHLEATPSIGSRFRGVGKGGPFRRYLIPAAIGAGLFGIGKGLYGD